MNSINRIKKWLYVGVVAVDLLYLLLVTFWKSSQWLQVRSLLGFFLLCLSVVLPLFISFLNEDD